MAARFPVSLSLAASIGLGGVAFGATTAFWQEPDLASSTYPNLGQMAGPFAPTFGAYNIPEYVGAFDNRDWQIQLAFDTASKGIPTGEPLEEYNIVRVSLTLTIESVVGTPLYDPTYDPQSTYPLVNRPATDPTPGRPIELFAAAFRNGYTGWDFSPTITPGPPLFGQAGEGYGPGVFGQGIRHVFPTDLVPGSGGSPRDVSNNLDEPNAGTGNHNPFDVTPLAIGTTDLLTPGSALTPGTELTFEIDLSNPLILDYVREGLQKGELGFIVATLLPAVGDPGGGLGGNYVRFYLRGNGPDSPAMTIEYLVGTPNDCPGDINGDGNTDIDDFIILAGNFGTPSGATLAEGDLNGDGAVDIDDFIILAGDFGCDSGF